jgi:hypothetical protein
MAARIADLPWAFTRPLAESLETREVALLLRGGCIRTRVFEETARRGER